MTWYTYDGKFLNLNGLFLYNPINIPTNGLIGFYKFNGNPNDLSGNNNNGIVNGATSIPDGYYFDGINDNIKLPVSSNGDYTIGLTFKAETIEYEDRLLGTTAGGTNQITLGWIENRQFRLWVDGWKTVNFFTELDIKYHIILTRSGNIGNFYVNGNLTVTTPSNYTFTDIGLGNPFLFTHGNYFNGYIYDTYVYNRALDSTEISYITDLFI